MSEKTEIIVCPKCESKFELTEVYGLGWEKVTYNCPYKDCDHTESTKSTGYFETRKLQ